ENMNVNGSPRHGSMTSAPQTWQQRAANNNLFEAVMLGLPEKEIRALLQNGASPSAVNAQGQSILEVAVQRGNLAIVRHLIFLGADIEQQTVQRIETGKN